MEIMQYRMARAALGWEVADLCAMSGVSRQSVARFVDGSSVLPVQLKAIRQAFEAHGVQFFEDG